jgi:hypothetical protein
VTRRSASKRARTAALRAAQSEHNVCMTDRDDEDFDWHEVDQMGLWEHRGDL